MPGAGIGHAFQVVIDGLDLGLWTSCSGLAAKYAVTPYEEGGQNAYVHQLGGRLSYENIKLKRAVDESSPLVATYFTSAIVTSQGRTTGAVTLFDGELERVASWHLVDVMPVSWTGPQLGSGKSEVAEEELELTHHGFTLRP